MYILSCMVTCVHVGKMCTCRVPVVSVDWLSEQLKPKGEHLCEGVE